MKKVLFCLIAVFASHSVFAEIVSVQGGQTNVVLDLATLEAAANLTLSGVNGPVIIPGNLDPGEPGSVAFPINSPTAAAPSLPSTFSYDTTDFLGSFSGTIEHSGTVLFNANAVEVGNFTIGFDGGRAGGLGGLASGFFVESTAGISAILFDIGSPSVQEASAARLQILGNLLVSSEFASFLLASQLASSDLSGAQVGRALVQASVPEPSSLLLVTGALFGLGFRRRTA